MALVFDMSRWPLLFVSVETLDSAGVEQLTVEYEAVFARRAHFVSVLDSSALRGIPQATERRAIAAWTKDNAHHMQQWNLGAATVVTNSPARGALTGLSWIFKPPSPQYYAKTRVDAYDWCAERLREVGLEPTPQMETLRAGWAREVGTG